MRGTPRTMQDTPVYGDVVGEVRDFLAARAEDARSAGVKEVWVDPACTAASPVALQAVGAADLVVLGPGSLYTSVLAAAVVGDLRKALADTSAQVVYVGNLRADGAETQGYDLAGHVAALRRHGIHPSVLTAARGALPVGAAGIDVVEADLASADGAAHDPTRLGAVLAEVVARGRPDWHRTG
jgi:hypothetical protein